MKTAHLCGLLLGDANRSEEPYQNENKERHFFNLQYPLQKLGNTNILPTQKAHIDANKNIGKLYKACIAVEKVENLDLK